MSVYISNVVEKWTIDLKTISFFFSPDVLWNRYKTPEPKMFKSMRWPLQRNKDLWNQNNSQIESRDIFDLVCQFSHENTKPARNIGAVTRGYHLM